MYRKPTFIRQSINFNSRHPYNLKKGIVLYLKHRARADSSDSNPYQEEMKSLRDNIHRNKYPESITSAQRNLNRTTANNTWKLTIICLPYIKGITEKIQKKCCPYDIRTIFRSGTTLCNYLFRVNPPREYSLPKNCVYSMPCIKVYIYLPTPPFDQDMTQGQFLSEV